MVCCSAAGYPRVVDGDTLDFSGTRVRMFGIGEQHSLEGAWGAVAILQRVSTCSNLRGNEALEALHSSPGARPAALAADAPETKQSCSAKGGEYLCGERLCSFVGFKWHSNLLVSSPSVTA